MREALKEADKALEHGEVPIGAVIVKDNNIISRAFNMTESTNDPTAHAEIIAIRNASQVLGDWRLNGCEIYVTLEPCPMCAFAIARTRIDKIFFGAYDPNYGACGSTLNLILKYCSQNKIEIFGGILKEESNKILAKFFENIRKSI